MLKDQHIDLNRFFSLGYTWTYLEPGIADRLQQIALNHNYIRPTVTKNTEQSYYDTTTGLFHSTSIPRSSILEGDESISPDMGTGFKDEADRDYLLNFWDKLAEHSYFDYFTRNFGKFSQISKHTVSYDVNSGFYFHSHTTDAAYLNNVIYCGDSDFTQDDGGYIEFAMTDIEPRSGMPIMPSIRETGHVLPNHGVMVTFCNLHPGVQHGVHRLMKSKNRISLIAQFAFRENLVNTLARKNWQVI